MARTVEPNYQKQEMYRNTIYKHKRAIELGFYCEAIMYDYALLEDRLDELLYELGLVNIKEDGLKVTSKTKKDIRMLLQLKDNSQFGINKISTKLELINKLVFECNDELPLLCMLSKDFKQLVDENELNTTIKMITEWKDKRNVFVHDLMNKSPRDLDEEAKSLAIDGKDYFRYIDKIVGRVKRRKFRFRYRIQ